MSDKEKKDEKKDDSTSSDLNYQFFTDGTSGYSFGLPAKGSAPANQGKANSQTFDSSLPDWFKSMTDGSASAASSSAASSNLPSTNNLPSSINSAPVQAAPVKPPEPVKSQSIGSQSIESQPIKPSEATAADPMASAPFVSDLTPAQKWEAEMHRPVVEYVATPDVNPTDEDFCPRSVADRELEEARKEKTRLGIVKPLNLAQDPRFSGLNLPAELNETVTRIFALVDLDFNNYVDFDEMSRVLDGDDLSPSEKSIVKVVMSVGTKLLVGREFGQWDVPSLTREDFRLAFAYDCTTIFKNSGISSVSVPVKKIRSQLYASLDCPLSSIKSPAVAASALGDPAFASVIGCMSELQPRAILRMIRTNLDGSYSILFPGSRLKPFDVMPPRPEEIVAYGLSDEFGYWYPLLEKAYGIYLAQSHRLAGAIGKAPSESQKVQQAIETLSNGRAERLVIADFKPGMALSAIALNLQDKRIVTAITEEQLAPTARLLPGKPYSILNGDAENGLVVIFSPYRDSSGEGRIRKFSEEEFRRFFRLLSIEKDNSVLENITEKAQPMSFDHWRRI